MLTPRRLLLGCSTAYFLLGIRIATAVQGPLLSADDIAYLAMGRTLAGRGAAPLPAQPPYGFLYPLLTAPGWAVGLSENSMLTYARGVNALAGALLVPVLYSIVRRLWRPTPAVALVAALIGAGLPALWLTASIAWTERLLALVVALAVLALLELWQNPTAARLAMAIGAGTACFAIHPRMGPAAVVVIAASAGLVWRRRPMALVGLLGGVVALAAVEWVRRSVASATFANTGTYDVGDLASRRGLDEVPAMLEHGLGAMAYFTLAGTGLAALGLLLLARTRPEGLVVWGIFGSTVAVAGWFLTGVDRSDAWLHGRYVEVVAPVVVAAGVVALTQLPQRLVVSVLVVAPLVGGVVATLIGPVDNWLNPRSPVMMLGVEVSGAPFGNDVFEPGAAASTAVVVGLALWGAWRLAGSRLLAGVAAIVIGIGVLSGLEGLDQLHDGSISGRVAGALEQGGMVTELLVTTDGVSPNLVAALAWDVGLSSTTTQLTESTSHLLLPPGASPPAGSVLVAEFGGGTLWAVR